MNLSIVGTSYDIRGIYPTDLDENFYYQFGRAMVEIFHFQKAAIGRDARLSSPVLTAALIRGITEGGADVMDVGVCSTDMISFATGHYSDIDFGIMVTASHNPKEYNGMKICLKDAVPVNTKTYGAQIRKLMEQDFAVVPNIGKIEHRDIVSDFVDHVCKFVDASKIRPLKVVADAGNGVAGVFFSGVAKKLGFECIPLYFEPDGDFPNHHPSPIEPENLEAMIEKVRETGADMGVAFDGDADRMFVVDENGEIFNGTTTTAIIAALTLVHNPGKSVIYNAVCGDVVRETVESLGGKAFIEKVGNVYIKEHMMRNPEVVFAGENSGHYFFQNNWNADSGIIAFVILLECISESNKPASSVRKQYDPYPRLQETNFRVADVRAKIAELKEKYADGEQSEFDGLTVRYADWWFNVRPSSGEPLLRLNIEARTEERLREKEMELRKLFA